MRGYLFYNKDSGMCGPYDFTGLEELLPERPGVYLLSYDGESVTYVGRSDTSLLVRVEAHDLVYDYFWFCEARGPVQAFKKECEEFHRYGGAEHLDNERHPARPEGYERPACSEVGCTLTWR